MQLNETKELRNSRRRRVVLRHGVGLAALLVAGCTQTISGAVGDGGTRMTAEAIEAEFPGLNTRAQFVQGYVATHSLAFAAEGNELKVDQHGGGQWSASPDGKLCLTWPKGLKWSRSGYCFAVVKSNDGYGLYDTVIDNLRIRLGS